MNRFTPEEKEMIERCVNACLDASLDVIEEHLKKHNHSTSCVYSALRDAEILSEVMDKLHK